VKRSLFIFLVGLVLLHGSADACDSGQCSLKRVGTDPSFGAHRWFFDFSHEGVSWDAMDAQGAHELHERGHHVDNKTHEEFYQYSFGFNPNEELTFVAQLPYVVRTMTEVENGATLGKKETSEGFGDAKLSAIWRFWRKDADFLGALGGVKLPTGSTQEATSVGRRFEPEMQPGTGATDGIAGAVYGKRLGRFSLTGSLTYTFRGEGDHDFRFGNGFSSYGSLETVLNPAAEQWNMSAGADFNWQIEDKNEQEGLKIYDSGGSTVLLGPAIKIETVGDWLIIANVLFPVHQDLGGVHQEINLVWNASVKALW
jgi:hypothetical protein